MNIEELKKQKDEYMIGKAGGNEQLMSESQRKLKVLAQRYKELSEASGLSIKRDRLKVQGYKK